MTSCSEVGRSTYTVTSFEVENSILSTRQLVRLRTVRGSGVWRLTICFAVDPFSHGGESLEVFARFRGPEFDEIENEGECK